MVSNSERFPKFVWFRYFRLAQGDDDKEETLLRDNRMHVLSHKNYPVSVGKSSTHINDSYFLVVDKIKKKEVRMVHFPSEEMIADYSSKPT